MELYQEMLLDVWREACRNIEIHDSFAAITRLLSSFIPLEKIVIIHVESGHSRIRAIVCESDRGTVKEQVQETIGSEMLEHITDTFFKDKDVYCDFSESDTAASLLRTGRAVAVSLPAAEKELYAVVFVPHEGITFSELEYAMLQRLREPFTVAVQNDGRVRELVRLREAAAADKAALLRKMSRREIGDTIIGANGGLRTVLERVSMIAPSDVPVLIFGETGTGKELIARAVHQKSGCSTGPFIRVNCGAIPSELIDSQLFGHEKGAFTGAVETRQGWFEKADGGTLLLDEAGEMPLKAQVRLLRVLQDGWMERVGGRTMIRVAVRIVLATHRDLAAMVAQGGFREDLYYRISTFPVFLPALRDRLEDLGPLAEHFARRSAIRFGLPAVMPSEEDVRVLASYDWPGNIRELASVIDRAALLGNGRELKVSESLGWTGLHRQPAASAPSAPAGGMNDTRVSPLDDVIRGHIETALTLTRGQIDGERGCAAMLRINPHTLRARMRKLGVDWTRFKEGR